MASLDRRCRVVCRGPGTRGEDGRFVPGPVVYDQNVWCSFQDQGSFEEITEGGAITQVAATVTIRFHPVIFNTRTFNIDVTVAGYPTGLQQVVDSIVQVGRQEFLQLGIRLIDTRST